MNEASNGQKENIAEKTFTIVCLPVDADENVSHNDLLNVQHDPQGDKEEDEALPTSLVLPVDSIKQYDANETVLELEESWQEYLVSLVGSLSESNKRKLPLINYDERHIGDSTNDFDSSESSTDEEMSDSSSEAEIENDDDPNGADSFWKSPSQQFSPRMKIPQYKEPETLIDKNLSIEDVFLKLFPRSLFIWIADCTNERLKILSATKERNVKLTDPNEIMVLIGCLLVMSYNRVPHMWMYWSEDESVRNEIIASAISRDRFMLLHSKLYFNQPKQPKDAGKTYYINEMVNCLLETFNRYRTEATFQSIDEFMVKFEGRTTMKQYQPVKPTKVGVKGYGRADAITGYMYDLYIYSGKNKENAKRADGTSGEQVVTNLCKSIREQDVGIVIDRFFTSVNLMRNLNYACVGTVMSTRKYLPDDRQTFKRPNHDEMQ
ncbi:hypothetical protein HA402_005949 [Bradysia odoriphaga]|nr:hypothetical protein HA402_005949 [Bradysia odoriphaga]